MTKRKTFLISSILVLTVIYIFQLCFSAKGKVKEISPKENIEAISFTAKGQRIELASINGEWFINKNNPLPAKKEACDYLKSTLSTIRIIDTVSKAAGAEDIEKYGLTNPLSVTVFGKQNKKIFTLLIGKTSTTGNQTYLQFEGKKDIYLVSGNLNNTFNVQGEDFLDLNLYSVDQKEIYKIQFTDKDNSFTAERAGEMASISWNISQKNEEINLEFFDSEKFQMFINSITELNASYWVEDFSKEILSADMPWIRVVISAAEKEITVELYKIQDSEETICICSENNYPCVISKEDVKKYNISLKDFIK